MECTRENSNRLYVQVDSFYRSKQSSTRASGIQMPRSNTKHNRILPAKSCSKHMTGNRSKLKNFVEKFIGSVRFGNDHFGAIMGYGDYVISDSVISRVYYVEGLGHNLFSTYLKVVVAPICTRYRIDGYDDVFSNLLLSKASTSKSWLCMSTWKKAMEGSHHKPNLKTSIWKVSSSYPSHGSVLSNEKSRFLRSKDETPEFVINFLKKIQIGLNKTVRYIRTDNGMEFVNQVMSEYYEGVGIFHQKSVLRTPQQNGVVERRNRTLVKAARTMMIWAEAVAFLWAEAVATACYTQNRSLIHTRHNKTPYELVHDKKPDLTFLRVFGALCYPTNDSEDLGKFQAKADIGIFVGYAPSRKGYRIYNKRTRRLMETIHVTFDEMHQTMAPVRISSGPEPIMMTPGQLNSGLAPSHQSTDSEPVPMATVVNAPIVSTNTSVSTTIAQDAPSTSHSLSSSQVHPPVFPQGVAAGLTIEDTSITQADLHPLVNPVAGEPSSAQSTSGDISLSEPNQVTQPREYLRRWTKDHPLDNIVGNPSVLYSTKNVQHRCFGCFARIRGHQEYFIANAASKNMILPDGCQNCFSEWCLQEEGLAPSAWYDTLSKVPVWPTNSSWVSSDSNDNALSLTAYVDADHCGDVRNSSRISAQSTSGDVSLAEPNQVNQPPDRLRKWTKDHPLDNIVGNPSRPVSTRKQLASDALWCCYQESILKLADILTKALPRECFKFLLPRLGMKSLTPEIIKCLQEGEDE
ncbi:integrase, catalytic region, zinc finger, CCHC-type containing protein [Tanacetum coccineum]